MSEPNTTAPALEETEADLAKLDPRTANILRCRLGLAPIEAEPPKVELAPETSARAAIREKLAESAATAVPAIDREALQRLDAEIEEKARAEAEPEAARRKAEQDPAIGAALAPFKARARKVSPVLRRREEAIVRIRAELPDRLLYQHSLLCQTVLPYRDPGPDVRKWERIQGEASLLLQAGHIRGKDGHFIPVGLPYGAPARRALLYLNTTALQTHNRVIDVDGGVTAWTRRILGRAPNGREIQQAKDAMTRLAASNITLAFGAGPRAVQVNSSIVTAFDLWEEHQETEYCDTPKTVMLSTDYFESLLLHAVPLDERAIAGLGNSPMALDVYAWLALRTHRLDPQRAQFIHWPGLYEQFGQGYKRLRAFRTDFCRILSLVKRHWPGLNATTDKRGMLLGNSPPPVPPRTTVYLPPAKPTKG